MDGENRPIPPGQHWKTHYHVDEQHWTTRVIKEGTLYVRMHGEHTEHRAKFSEFCIDEESGRLENRSLVIFPIVNASSDRVDGVIRCFGRHGHGDIAFRDSCFDSFQIETLEFVANQISPVLETFATRIFRDRHTADTRHDLFSAISGMEESIAWLQRDHRIVEVTTPAPGAGVWLSPKERLYDFAHNHELAVRLARGLGQKIDKGGLNRIVLERDILRRVAELASIDGHIDKKARIVVKGFRDISGSERAGVPPMFANVHDVERVFSNLLGNAVKYSDGRPVVVESVFSWQEGLRVYISNYGVEIDPDESALVFESGYRSRRAQTTEIPGTGLGLDIAARLMDEIGGSIELQKAADPVIFIVSFPPALFRFPILQSPTLP